MKQTARALIINQKKQFYMLVHNYYNPKHKGKWSTVGGLIEEDDISEAACLKREITEEFGQIAAKKMHILSKVSSIRWVDEYDKNNLVLHHFYHVEYRGNELVPNKPDEIIEGRFLNWGELQKLKIQNKLFFGCEDELFFKITLIDSE